MSRAAFDQAIEFILPQEEEFRRGHWGDENYVVTEDVPGDGGGLTKYGIDHSSHPGVDIANLDKAGAVEIYWFEWQKAKMDLLPDKLSIAAFDVFVNGGFAIRWLQHAYNAIHETAPQLAEDGNLGPATAVALASADQDAILHFFLDERDTRFRALAQNPNRAKFLTGWLQRDADLAKLLSS